MKISEYAIWAVLWQHAGFAVAELCYASHPSSIEHVYLRERGKRRVTRYGTCS